MLQKNLKQLSDNLSKKNIHLESVQILVQNSSEKSETAMSDLSISPYSFFSMSDSGEQAFSQNNHHQNESAIPFYREQNEPFVFKNKKSIHSEVEVLKNQKTLNTRLDLLA